MFKRGQVFEGNIPELIHTEVTPPPGFILYGKHKLVVLHNSDSQNIDSRVVIVAPITSAKAEVRRAQREGRHILASYVPLSAADHPFLDHDSYISTAQVMPINREWLHADPVGKIDDVKLWEIGYLLVSNLELFDVVEDLALQKVQSMYGIGEAAAGSED